MKDHKDKMCVCVCVCVCVSWKQEKLKLEGKIIPYFLIWILMSAQLIFTQAPVEGSDEQDASSQTWLGAFINA